MPVVKLLLQIKLNWMCTSMCVVGRWLDTYFMNGIKKQIEEVKMLKHTGHTHTQNLWRRKIRQAVYVKFMNQGLTTIQL